MNYRIVEKEEMVLTGFKRRFTGTPENRKRQDHEFAVTTRLKQYVLQGFAHDCDTVYEVITNVGDDGYDYYIASWIPPVLRNDFEEDLGEFCKQYEKITVPAGKYLVCETERCEYPTDLIGALRAKAVTEWLPSAGYELANAPEFDIIHWYWKYNDEKVNNSRYTELWLPIVKK